MPTAKASILVAIAAGTITVKPNAPFVSLHSPFRFSRIMLIPIMHRRNSATYLETASMYWRIVPPQIYPSVGISAWNPPKYSPATSPVFTGCILVFKPLHTETAKASIDRPTATSNRIDRPITLAFIHLSVQIRQYKNRFHMGIFLFQLPHDRRSHTVKSSIAAQQERICGFLCNQALHCFIEPLPDIAPLRYVAVSAKCYVQKHQPPFATFYYKTNRYEI